MKKICYILIYCLFPLSFVVTSCQDDYDPIGNNKPAPVLKISPLFLTFDGGEGEVYASISTNSSSLETSTPPSWITNSFNSDYTEMSATAQANDDMYNIRTGIFQITTVTGQSNEAAQTINFVQAATNGILTFDSFSSKDFEKNWQTEGSGDVSLENSYLSVGENTLLVCKESSAFVTQANNVVIASVDIKADCEGGLQVYLTDDPGNSFSFFFTINNTTGTGGFYAFHGSSPMALGDAIPGDPLNGTEMPKIPSSGERDDYFRIEFSNSSRWPNWWQSEVNIYSLKTTNGETKVLKKHYTRKFEIDNPKPQPGYFAVWSRGTTCYFRNFILSAQNN